MKHRRGRALRRRYGHVYKRVPLVRVVMYPQDAGGVWAAEVFDADGNLRTGVNNKDRAFVERKVREFWPDLPIEQGTTPRYPHWRIK